MRAIIQLTNKYWRGRAIGNRYAVTWPGHTAIGPSNTFDSEEDALAFMARKNEELQALEALNSSSNEARDQGLK